MSSRTVVALLVLVLTLSGTSQADAGTVQPGPGPRLAATQQSMDDALSCPRTAGRRAPVLLVHGTSTTPEISWSEGLLPLLTRDGFTVCTVRLPADAVGDIDVASHFVVAAVRTMAERYHRPVNLVGHSQGGMLLRWVLKWWPDTRSLVGDVIGLASSNHGSSLAGGLCVAACPAGIWQQVPGSRFLTALNAGDDTPGRVEHTVLYSETDTTVSAPSPVIEGDADDTNIAVQSICPGREVSHTQMQYDAVSVALVRDALAHQGPARATRVSRALCRMKYAAGIDEQAADRQQQEGTTFSVVAIASAEMQSAEPPPPAFAARPAPRPHARITARRLPGSGGQRLVLRAVGTGGGQQWPLPFATFVVDRRRVTAGPDGRATVHLPRGTRPTTVRLRAQGLATVYAAFADPPPPQPRPTTWMDMTKTRVPPTDAMFLYLESPETKMHVAGLKYFTPPAGAGPDFVRELHEQLRAAPVERPWNRKLATPRFLRNPVHAWVEDQQFDIDYHVRRSALASPGDERELGVLVSRLHSNAIDFSRPPWEMHLIEGLAGGRFAAYVKIHHSLVDGFTGVQLLQRCLSTTPEDRSAPFFFSTPPRSGTQRPTQKRSTAAGLVAAATTPVRLAGGTLRSTASVARAATNLQLSRRAEHSDLVRGLSAPPSLLNRRTGRNRRFATAQLDLADLRSIATAAGGTVNDVVMTVFGGGLRTYLAELDELPGRSLVGFLPVNIRPEGDAGGGTQVGATLAPMGTDVADPVDRLRAITASTTQAKAQMSGMTQGAMLAYSGYLLAPAALQTVGAVAGLSRVTPATFNLCVSNVPGPQQTLYFRGARLDAYYPVSIPMHGMALNITCLSYDGQMNVGFVGCRDALPHLQRLAVHTTTAFEELREAVGVQGRA